ncbi:permease (plasmid) [Gemmatirosa kalamazoonensis]|uniref:Permease n=1 Tax=Gemmatirosa kalamazoonensis TaxID=861299 RepID=W0RSL7_9BACT|nr:ABC transporter permease [Gemmatirosa kalamazoonensis]AHG93676.1 permease [Gemmatirosa kalamazoonensis]
MLQTLARDLRFAGRMLRKTPVFTAIAVLVIALGTGAVTTIFSVANAVALRPLPGVSNADAVVEVHRALPDGTGDNWVSYPLYRFLRDGAATRPMADLAAWSFMPLTIDAGEESVAAQGAIVTGNYFGALGVRPALGRFFTPDEDGAPGAHPVVVISHGFWTTRLGADPRVIGRTVRVNGYAFTVVGVAPPRFGGVFALMRTDAWVPMAALPLLSPGNDLLTNPRPGWLQTFALVRSGVDRSVVQRELSRLVAQYAAEGNGPADDRRYTTVRLASLSGLPYDMHGRVLGFMALLLGASGLVLLIASINVAAMLLARAVARRRETAVRLALGATRGRLVRQLLTESLLLYVVGAAGGVLIALYATRLLARLPLSVSLPLAPDFAPDARVLAFALVLSLVTGVAFGLAPALQSARVGVSGRLRDDTAGAGSRRSTVQSLLIAGQMSVSFLLLVAAGLFLRALDRGRHVDLGFDTSNVAVAGFDLGMHEYDDAKGRLLLHALKDRIAQSPRVVAVSYARNLPLSGGNSVDLRIDGSPVPPANADGTPVRFEEVDAGYFETLQMPIVEGRGFIAADDERAARVAVVNQAFVRRFWPAGGSAIGRTFRRGSEAVTIVGVARDAKYWSLGEELRPFAYFAIGQAAARRRADHAELLVRTSGDAARLAPAIRAAVRELDPALPAPAVTTLSAETSGVLLPQRVGALVTAVMGAVGLLLAAVGLYGIVAYLVGQRAREIGVRMALGAGRRDVLRLVTGDGMRPVAVGLGIGLLLAVGTTRLLMSFLLGVSPLDVVTFAGGAAILIAVALAASWLPARRAAATDPVRALRAE